MADPIATTIPGVTLTVDDRAVLLASERPLSVLSSAVVGGGLCRARHVVNMHVAELYGASCPEDDLAAFAASCGINESFVGLMTAAGTEHARLAVESEGGVTVAAVVSVGLSNTASAGVTPPAPLLPGTINVILAIDAALTAAAMVNAVITATEAKTMTLVEWDVRTPDGAAASGTSTDSVVVACTGRGDVLGYAGPATTVGWLIGRTVRAAIGRISQETCARNGGRFGW